MLFKGTARRPVGAIAADVEAAGGEINAWTSLDQTVYHVTIASRELPVALDILADAVQNSSFDPDELSRELEVVLEEVRRGRDQPSRVASKMLMRSLFEAHPYERPVIGYEETIRKFTRPMILDFYRRWYQPQNMCLVVVGDVSAAEVVQLAERLFDANLNTGALPARPRTPAKPHERIRGQFAAQDIKETHLSLAWPTTPVKHEDTPTLDVLSVILGMGESARLYARVKWRDQLVNDCYATTYSLRDCGATLVGGQIHGDGVQQALTGLLTETFRLRFEDVDDSELAKARTILEAGSIYQRETVQGTARKLGLLETLAGDVQYEDEYFKKVNAVTSADIRDVALRYLDPERFSVSALTPMAQEGALDSERASTIARGVIQALEAEYAHAPTRRPTGSPRRTEPKPAASKKSGAAASPQVTQVTLDNGARLLVLPDASVPLVSVRTAGYGGLIAETEADNGAGAVLGELLVRGTETNSYSQLTEETDAMAASLAGISGRNSVGLSGSFLKDSWPRGFELFSDCLLHASLPPDEFEKVRQTHLEDVIARQDSAPTVAFDRMLQMLFAGHPYGRPTVGREETVKTLTIDDMTLLYRKQLRPDRMVVCVVGDVDVDETVQMVQSQLGQARPHSEANEVSLPKAPAPLSGCSSAFTARDKEQAHIVLGFRGYAMEDERHYALEILSSVLGGQSGRVFIELRDKASLA
ncbi:MAG: pitrilysin family protein, partial [Myxococcota bacterium]